jgi:hypothetical protein
MNRSGRVERVSLILTTRVGVTVEIPIAHLHVLDNEVLFFSGVPSKQYALSLKSGKVAHSHLRATPGCLTELRTLRARLNSRHARKMARVST